MGQAAFIPMLLGAMAFMLLYLGMRSSGRRSGSEIQARIGRYAAVEDPQQKAVAAETDEGLKERHRPNRFSRGLENRFRGRNVSERTALMLTQANVLLTVGEFLSIRLLAAGIGVLLGFVIGGIAMAALAIPLAGMVGFIGFKLPGFYLRARAKKRRKLFNEQLADTINLMANSLRAGYSMLQTMELVSRETQDPVSTEFGRVVREVGLGIDYQTAMKGMLTRVPSEDLDILVTAINIQHEVGGNLAQILTTIGETIRERVRIKNEVSVLTAQAKMSGIVISLMPFFIGGLIFLVNPDYMKPMFSGIYLAMPGMALVMIGMGFMVMRKISDIEI